MARQGTQRGTKRGKKKVARRASQKTGGRRASGRASPARGKSGTQRRGRAVRGSDTTTSRDRMRAHESEPRDRDHPRDSWRDDRDPDRFARGGTSRDEDEKAVLASREGERVPDVRFRTRDKGEWKDVTSADLFAGKTVIVFALPGAFTPTCSSTHLPGFESLAAKLREHGVDDILCLSVNDAFVMNAWAEHQGISNVRLIPDGNGHFTEAMGMLVDKEDLGFGKRSWRYSMLVRDGVIEKMFIEPQVEGDPFEISDAETMLDYLESHPARD